MVLGVGQMQNESPRWHSEDFAILDLRRMRSILQDLPHEMRQQVVNNLREGDLFNLEIMLTETR